MLPIALRKAAILISTLDERTAEALLGQMAPEEASKVRSALVELDEIPSAEEQQVLTEFMRQQESPALAKALYAEASDVELEISSAQPDDQPAPPPADLPLPLQFLASVAAEQLARALHSEQPQTIAAVIAHLTPAQSAGVLEHLPPELATDSLERLATLAPLAPAVLADLEQELQRRLAMQGGPLPNSAAAERLSAVIGAMDFRQRERVLLQLAQRNAALVGCLGLSPVAGESEQGRKYRATHFRYRLEQSEQAARKARPAAPVLNFADLAQLDDGALRAVFAAADPAVALLALTGAEERLLGRVMNQLPAREVAVLRERLEHPGPVRLREIELAQNQLATVANRLVQDGEIQLPASVRFAATA